MDIVASVAMNGGRLPRVISKPENVPHSAPTPSAATIATGIGMPFAFDIHPMTIMDTARTDPTDRSMPPMTITAVMPSAMMPSTVS